ncbi:site-specific DNA-methyltransferase [Flexistipes sinusarabici]|uniref:site-specific DNA-methyltransferase n=1 Tax=Flexistipes sinusarabici TaxID=2352 RepID=UPI00145C3D5E|nr:site-specific DNA-methyltransferase [Flexistipes sinusarabici]
MWPFKDCILEGGQSREEQKREEIFFNETLAQDEITQLLEPKVLTNAKSYDKEGERPFEKFNRNSEMNKKRGLPEDTITDNLLIKGNNLLALHSLKKEFAGKVKLIYIDPPYNTEGDANTFLYNNSFNHSTWLTFMKNRLEISKYLMKDDGVIAIAIDDEEQAHLKVLCDEVFGRDNFMGTLIVQIKPSGRTTDAYFATCHEYVLFYSKIPNRPKINFFELTEEERSKYTEGEGDDIYKWRDFLRTGGYSTPEERPNSYYPIYYNPDNKDISLENKGQDYIEILPIDSNGRKRVWRKIPKSFNDHLKNGEIKIVKRNSGSYKVQLIDKIKEGTRPKSVWTDSKYDASSHGTKLLKDLFDGEKVFSFPKSLYSVKDIIEIFTEKGGNDIILDFFAGSGTTAHATLELNQDDEGARNFILCEQLFYVDSVTIKRIKKVLEETNSNETFVAFELSKYNNYFVEKIETSKNTDDLLSIWEQMKEKSFLNYNVDIKKQEEHIEEFKQLSLEQQKQHLFKLLDKNQLYVNLSSLEDEDFACTDEEKKVTKNFYQIKE